MDPEPSWSKILKACWASFSSFLVRYIRIECLISYMGQNRKLNIIQILSYQSHILSPSLLIYKIDGVPSLQHSKLSPRTQRKSVLFFQVLLLSRFAPSKLSRRYLPGPGRGTLTKSWKSDSVYLRWRSQTQRRLPQTMQEKGFRGLLWTQVVGVYCAFGNDCCQQKHLGRSCFYWGEWEKRRYKRHCLQREERQLNKKDLRFCPFCSLLPKRVFLWGTQNRKAFLLQLQILEGKCLQFGFHPERRSWRFASHQILKISYPENVSGSRDWWQREEKNGKIVSFF